MTTTCDQPITYLCTPPAYTVFYIHTHKYALYRVSPWEFWTHPFKLLSFLSVKVTLASFLCNLVPIKHTHTHTHSDPANTHILIKHTHTKWKCFVLSPGTAHPAATCQPTFCAICRGLCLCVCMCVFQLTKLAASCFENARISFIVNGLVRGVEMYVLMPQELSGKKNLLSLGLFSNTVKLAPSRFDCESYGYVKL